MKKFVVTLLVGAFALTVCLGTAQARPAYPAMIAEHYKDNKAIVEKSMSMKEKCFLCHDSASTKKQDRNEYGKALAKHMTKDEFMKLNKPDDKAKLAAKLGEMLKATEADKHSSGKTFGEVIKEGKLPGEK
jgi:hypothetical protein